MKSLTQQLEGIVQDYIKQFKVDVVDLDQVAEWAVETGRYQRKAITLAKQCKRELARVLRSEHLKGPKGHEPRKWHAVHVTSGDEQLVLWADIRRAKPNHMRISLGQRRQAMQGTVKQHKTDTEWYNDNNSFNVTIPLFDYDFNKDMDELNQPTEYPDGEDGYVN